MYGAYRTYVHSHGRDASWVADAMAQEGAGGGVQPWQNTEWGRVIPPLDLTKQT